METSKKITMKTFLVVSILIVLFGCSSEEIFSKDKIEYSNKGLYDIIVKEHLLFKVENIRHSKCKDLAEKKLKKDNLSQAREIRKLYPDFIPTGFMANGVNTSSGEFALSGGAAEHALAGADLAVAAQNTKAGMAAIAVAGGMELYQMYKNSPILDDPRVQAIIKKYNQLYEDQLNSYVEDCTLKVIDIDISEYEKRSHFFKEDTVERDIELEFSIYGEEDDSTWSELQPN